MGTPDRHGRRAGWAGWSGWAGRAGWSGWARWAGWTARGRRIAAAPATPIVAGALLAAAAVAETAVRAATETGVLGGRPGLVIVVFCLVAVATTAPVALPRPTAAALTVSAANVLSLTAYQILTTAGVAAQVIVLYRLGRSGAPQGRPRFLTLALALPFLVLALADAGARVSGRPGAPGGYEEAFLVILLASLAPAAAWAGIARRARGEALAHSTTREALAGSLVEHTARGERARIARELHDVVAHHISMVAIQAETARLTTPGLPPAGARRLSEIGDTARAGLTEMRRLLGVLREDAEAVVADRHPQPGLNQLNELIDESRDASGAGTRLIVSGPPMTFEPGVELAAYRIIQEALTNARRHAPGAAVDVELRYTDDALLLRVRDNGPGPPTAIPAGMPAAGHGLLGMRERAAAAGGELRTSPAPGGGFLIEAWLPAKTEVSP